MKYYEERPKINVSEISNEFLKTSYFAQLHMAVKAHEKLAYAVHYGTESMKRRAMGWVRFHAAILKQYEDEIHRRGIDGYQRS